MKLIALGLILGALLAFGYSMLQRPVYQATATGYIGAGNPASVGDAFSGDALGSQRADTYIALITSRPVAQRVVTDLGLGVPPETLVDRASGAVVKDAPLIRITASAPTGAEARDLADSFMAATAAEAVKLETGGTGGTPVVRLLPLESALVPTEPVSPDVPRIVGMGALIGLVLAYATALARRTLDNRVRHAQDIEQLTGSKSLGVIPRTSAIGRQREHDAKSTRGRGGATAKADLGEAAEALRQLRTNLRYVDVDRDTRTIVVTSPNAGEGKSTIAANLGRILAASGQPTIVVDADLRRPMQARIFHVDQEVGLTQVLAGEVGLADALVATDHQLLKILPAGRIPPNPSELLGSHRMAAALKALSADHLVLIDAPPLLPVTDAGLLTAESDGALLIVRAGKTFKEQVRMCARALERVNGRLLGTVLNMVNPRELGAAHYGYGHGSQQRAYTSHAAQATETRAAPAEASVRLEPTTPDRPRRAL